MERAPTRPGSLGAKTLGIVAATTAAMVLGVCVPLRQVVLGRFEALERDLARRDLDRARNTLDDEVATLHALGRDYANWDDTWAYLGGASERYVEANFPDATFAQNRIGLLVIVDASRRVRFAQGFDLARGVRRPAPPIETLFPTPSDALYAHLGQPRGDVAGLVASPQGLMLVGANPVLTSARTGPARGTLLMGRALDAAEVARLARRLRLALTVEPVGGPHAASDTAPALASMRGRAVPTMIRALDASTLCGYAVVRDVRGAPCAVMRVALGRDVYAQGVSDARFIMLSVAAACVLFGVVVVLLLQRTVVRRITRLGRDVSAVGAHGDLTLRVAVTGRDELTVLASDVNAMLVSLERLTRLVEVERAKSDRLLRNILPASIAERLRDRHQVIAESFQEVSVLFADIVGFTDLSSRVTPQDLVVMLNEMFSRFDALAERHGLEKIKTIGDAYMVVAGVPEPRDDHADALAAMALDMIDAVEAHNAEHGTSLSMRIGVNTGPVVAGVIGTKKFTYDLWGDTVNLASRMESNGVPGRVQVAEATWRLLRDRYAFEERGVIKVKGKGEVRAWLLVGRRASTAPRPARA
jgi:adenylate cyclase